MDYYSIPEFDATGLVTTVFTSKGRGCWLSNNPEGWENYRAVAAHFGLTDNDMTATFQRHSNSVQAVTRREARRHVFYRPEPMVIADGIVTNEPGLMLCSMESDCTPVFLLDPVKKAVGMVHSGWKGTASLIASKAVQRMEEEYGTDPSDVLAAFGPSICADCYEVGEDLIPPFSENFSPEEIRSLFLPKADGKYLLDVNRAITLSLLHVGLREENIFPARYCTCHDGLFYSHRRQVKDGLPGKDNMFTGIMLNRSPASSGSEQT